jgi:hypothetical protein
MWGKEKLRAKRGFIPLGCSCQLIQQETPESFTRETIYILPTPRQNEMSDKYGWVQGGNGDFNSVSTGLSYLFRTLYSALFILHSLQHTVFLGLMSESDFCRTRPTPNMESDTSPKYSSLFNLHSFFIFLSPCKILHNILHTAYCILHTAHSTVYSIHRGPG